MTENYLIKFLKVEVVNFFWKKWFGFEVQFEILAPPINFCLRVWFLGGHSFSTRERDLLGEGTPLHPESSNKFVASFMRVKNGRRVSLHTDLEGALALWPSGGQLYNLYEKTCTACFNSRSLFVCNERLVSKKRLGKDLFHLHHGLMMWANY